MCKVRCGKRHVLPAKSVRSAVRAGTVGESLTVRSREILTVLPERYIQCFRIVYSTFGEEVTVSHEKCLKGAKERRLQSASYNGLHCKDLLKHYASLNRANFW